MNYLPGIELTEGIGKKIGAVLKTDRVPTMMECGWMDHDRRNFISTTSPQS